MPLDVEKLQSLLERKYSEATNKAVVKFFHGAPESERKKLATHCQKWLRQQLKLQMDEWMKGRDRNNNVPAAALAAYAACSFSALSRLGSRGGISGDLAYELLADRRPEWIGEWAEKNCKDAERLNWPVIRRLINEGLCPTPTHENYIRLMIDHIDGRNIAREFEADPGLLENEFWRIFEIPGVMQSESLLGYVTIKWAPAVARLVEKGKLDRRRVLESCLSATRMGFNRSQIKAFLEMHDRLKPTIAEQLEMRDAYAGLLESDLPPVVKFGFERLQTLDKKQQLDEPWLCNVLQAAVRQPTKAMAGAALRWLGQLLKRNPACAPQAAQSALQALLHPQVSVQETAWKLAAPLLQQDAALRAEVERLAPSAAPTIRKEIELWLKDNSSSGAEAPAATSPAAEASADLETCLKRAKQVMPPLTDLLALPELITAAQQDEPPVLPGCRFDGTDLARLPHHAPLQPIESFDELIEVAAGVLEDGNRNDDGERVLEALCRFTISADNSHLADPLIKRASDRLNRGAVPFQGVGIQHDLPVILLAWAGQSVVDFLTDETYPAGLAGFLSKRSQAIARRLAAGEPFTILALPTHSGGWIDPQVLAARALAVRSPAELIDEDMVLALLRLAPDGRDAALKQIPSSAHEFRQALRYALGAASRKLGDSAHLWIAAARARKPYQDDPLVEKAFPERGPDAGRAAKYDVETKHLKSTAGYTNEVTTWYAEDSPLPPPHEGYETLRDVDYLLPTTLPHAHDGHCDLNFMLDTKPCPSEIVQAAATVWPIARESFFRVGGEPIVNLEPLFDPNAPLLPVSNYALLSSLGSGYAPERTLAVDVAIAVIGEGRFDAGLSGRQLSGRVSFARRYALTLADVAAASPLHAWQVACTLSCLLAHQPANIPTTFGSLLELYYQLLVELGASCTDEAARKFLGTFRGSSKTAKVAGKILKLEPNGEFPRDEILAQAIAGRLDVLREPLATND